MRAAAVGVDGKSNVPLTQDNVLVPFDAAARDAERALEEARAILLSTRRALAVADPDAGSLDSAEGQLSSATKALLSLKASLAAVRGGSLPQVGAQQGAAAVADALAALRAVTEKVPLLPTTADSAVAAVNAALRHLSSATDVHTKRMAALAREDPSSAFVASVMAGGLLLATLGGALLSVQTKPPAGKPQRAAGGVVPTAATVAKGTKPVAPPATGGVQVQKAASAKAATKPAPPVKPAPVKPVVKAAAAVPAPAQPVVKAAPAAPAVKASPAPMAPVKPAVAAKAPAPAAKAVPVKAAAPKVAPPAAPKVVAAPPAPKVAPPAAPKVVAAPPAPKVAPIAPPPAAVKPAAPVAATPAVKAPAPVAPVKQPAAVVPAAPARAAAPLVAPLRDVSGPSLGGRASYAVHNAFATPLSRAVLFATFALATVAAGGAAYSAASGAGLPAAALKAYSLLNNVPGATVNDGPNTASQLTANGLFIVGSFTFAVLIGLVGDTISTKAQAVASSNAAIAEAGHTLVLGWNAAAGVMLRQLAAGPGGASTPVVILSSLPRHQVQAEVAAAFAHGQGPYPRVIVRTGSPVSEVDLRAVCAGAAAHVVVLQPDHAEAGAPAALEADATKALALISLSPVKGVPPPRVTVEMKGPPSEDFLTTALAARSRTGTSGAALVRRTTLVDARGSLAHTLATCCTHAGLADVFSDGLAAAGDVGGLHCVPLPRGAVGKRFGDVWRKYKAPVAGFVRPAHQPGAGQHATVFLAPPDAEVLRKGDVLVMYASSPGEAAARTWFAPTPAQPAAATPPAPAPATHAHAAPAAAPHKHILIAGLERTGLADDLLRALSQDSASGSRGGTTVTVLSSSLTRRDVGKWTNATCRFSLVSGSAAKRADLLKAGASTADHVMLLAPPGVGDGDSHVTTLAALLQLQDIAVSRQQQQASPLHVLLTLGGHQAASLAQRVAHCGGNALRLDVIDVHRLGAAAIAADVASRAESAAADALLHGRGGTGLALRPVSAYLGQQQAASGWRLADAVRASGDVLIGWRLGDQRVAVATDRGATRVWGPADHVLVVKGAAAKA